MYAKQVHAWCALSHAIQSQRQCALHLSLPLFLAKFIVAMRPSRGSRGTRGADEEKGRDSHAKRDFRWKREVMLRCFILASHLLPSKSQIQSYSPPFAHFHTLSLYSLCSLCFPLSLHILCVSAAAAALAVCVSRVPSERSFLASETARGVKERHSEEQREERKGFSLIHRRSVSSPYS